MGCSASTQVTAHACVVRTGPPAPRFETDARGVGSSLAQKVGTNNCLAGSSFHEKFVLQNKLGKGAFAQVYLVKPASSNKEFESHKSMAAKVTDLRLRGADGRPTSEVDNKSKKTVQKEVDLLQKLTNIDSVLRVYESYFEDCLSFIIVEKCDSSLLAALERLPEVSERALMRVFHQIYTGLDAVHKLDIVHRDIKPDNFLCKRGTTSDGMPIVKICDFGMAEELVNSRPTLRGVYGTAPFMSPEMLNKKAYGTKTDVWSTFVVCYVLFFGKFPYQPVQANASAMKAAVISGMPEPSFNSTAMLPDLSSRATRFLHKQFERDPDNRLSAGELLAIPDLWSTESDAWGHASLRPVLNAAKRCGAFDTRRVKDDENDVDAALRSAQKKYHGSTDDASSCSTRLGEDNSRSNSEAGSSIGV